MFNIKMEEEGLFKRDNGVNPMESKELAIGSIFYQKDVLVMKPKMVGLLALFVLEPPKRLNRVISEISYWIQYLVYIIVSFIFAQVYLRLLFVFQFRISLPIFDRFNIFKSSSFT